MNHLTLPSAFGFMPHGMCYLWQPGVLSLHVISDALITLSYFSIPFTLVYFVRKRRDLQFNWMFLCFAIFIVACGLTHLMEIWVVWQPHYWLSGSIKALTAAASVPTAILLVLLVPKAVRLPSQSALRQTNAELQQQIAERERAEAAVRRLNEELEARVRERTRELEAANHDLRETQRTVMQQERLRALGQMASGIAHDINNAISPVALYAESLLEHEHGLSTEARGQISTMQRAIDDVANTVGRMREFYRSREPEMPFRNVDLNQLVQQVAELTRARRIDLPQREGVVIDLRIDAAPDLPPVAGAEHEIRDALINLIFNAVDAMPGGGVLTISTLARVSTCDAETVRQACIAVRDTGVGMDEETRRRCLEPFFTTKGERGTGLGLAMVYGMVQRHGAGFEIDSVPGRGTTVGILFPPAKIIASAVQTIRVRSSSPLRLLIIDDDTALLETLHDTLQLDNHIITTADGGQTGIDAFMAAEREGRPFDVVITDLGMPYVDGHQVARAVRTQSPTTPIIMITGWGQQSVAEHNVPGHVDRVLSKPPRLQDLRRALAEVSELREVTARRR